MTPGATGPTVSPSGPWGLGPSTKSLLHFDGSATADGAGVSWTAENGIDVTSDRSKYGSHSLATFGDGFVVSETASAFDLSNRIPFVVECWIYPTEMFSERGIFSMRTDNSICPVVLRHEANRLRWHIGNSALNGWSDISYSSYGAISYSTWNHVAVAGNGSTVAVYANGVQVLSAAHPSWASGPRFFMIGNDVGWMGMTGNLDEFRVRVGVSVAPSVSSIGCGAPVSRAAFH